VTKEEGDRLLAENAALRAALASMQGRLDALLDDNAALRTELNKYAGQQETLLELAAGQNEKLSALTDMMRRRLQRAPKKDDDSGDDDEPPPAGAGPSPADLIQSELDGKRPRRSRRKGRRGGRRVLGAHVPSTEERHRPDACLHCGGSHLLARDTEVVDIVDVIRAHVRRRRIVREVKTCCGCGKATTATMPPMPCPRAGYTCEFLAWLVVQHFVLLVPVNRIRSVLLTQGVDIPKGTLSKLIERASDLLGAIDNAHWQELKAGRWLAFDGTGLKVRLEGMPTTWLGYLDVFNRGPVTVYQFALTKHGDELEKKLAKFKGTLVCDAESRHDALFASGERTVAHCNAHARRQFRDSESVQPVLAPKAGRFLRAMYWVEAKAKERKLVGAERLAYRQSRIRPIVDRFRGWLEEVAPTLLPSDALGKAVRYYLKHFDALTRFVDDAELPIDNNASERAFQDHARLRLVSLFAGSVEGAHRWATILGVVESAKRLDLDVFDYLVWAFERRGTWKKRFGLTAAQLTPAAYKQVLQERARCAA
jgi:transposase